MDRALISQVSERVNYFTFAGSLVPALVGLTDLLPTLTSIPEANMYAYAAGLLALGAAILHRAMIFRAYGRLEEQERNLTPYERNLRSVTAPLHSVYTKQKGNSGNFFQFNGNTIFYNNQQAPEYLSTVNFSCPEVGSGITGISFSDREQTQISAIFCNSAKNGTSKNIILYPSGEIEVIIYRTSDLTTTQNNLTPEDGIEYDSYINEFSQGVFGLQTLVSEFNS